MLLELTGLDEYCETDRTLEGSSHAFEAVLDQVTLQLRRRVESLTAQLTFVVQPLFKHMICHMNLNVPFTMEDHLTLNALVCLLLFTL